MQPIAELPPASILIVDDHPASLLALEVLLEPLGHELVSARSGPEALHALHRRDFALIVMDVDMPGMDGIRTAELIKASSRHRHIPILFVTDVRKETSHALRAYETGGVDYVTKPCEDKILRMKVSALVDVSLQREIVKKEAELRCLREREALQRACQDRVEEAERRARAEAEAETARSSAMKSEFLTTVSHELRTPLTTILLNARILQKPTLSPEHAAQAVERIARSAAAQTRVIDNMLDASRIATGKLEMRLERVDAVQVIERAIDALRPTAQRKRVALAAEIEPKKALIMADPGRVQQILWELILNGIKFTPAGGRIDVRVKLTGEELEIAVSDTGQGIPAARLSEVFHCFSKADVAPGGLGVGLSLARKLVELHGGSIGAESEGLGRGATFTIHLPHARRRRERAPAHWPRARSRRAGLRGAPTPER